VGEILGEEESAARGIDRKREKGNKAERGEEDGKRNRGK
jgi:hypothetical protein